MNRTVESFTELLLTSFPSREMSLATNPAQKARDTSSVLPHTAPCELPSPLLLHKARFKPCTGTSVPSENIQVQYWMYWVYDLLWEISREPKRKRRTCLLGLPRTSSLPFQHLSSSSEADQHDSRDTEMTEFFPHTRMGRAELRLAEQHLALASFRDNSLDAPQP